MESNSSSLKANFLAELELAQQGRQSSLSWLSVSLDQIRPKQSYEYYIQVGGTNVRIFKQNQKISEFEIFNETSGAGLFEKILSEVDQQATSIYLNFGFPISSKPHSKGLSAVLLQSTKGHNFDDILGIDLADLILKFKPNITEVLILNDTIYKLADFNQVNDTNNAINACLVLGTGFNLGLIYQNAIVNLEAGNFNHFKPLITTQIIDQNSNNKKHQLLEKEIAGKYLYQHYNLLSKQNHLSSSAQLAQIENGFKTQIFLNVEQKILLIKSAIEEFMLPEKTSWIYDGAIIEYLNNRSV